MHWTREIDKKNCVIFGEYWGKLVTLAISHFLQSSSQTQACCSVNISPAPSTNNHLTSCKYRRRFISISCLSRWLPRAKLGCSADCAQKHQPVSAPLRRSLSPPPPPRQRQQPSAASFNFKPSRFSHKRPASLDRTQTAFDAVEDSSLSARIALEQEDSRGTFRTRHSVCRDRLWERRSGFELSTG